MAPEPGPALARIASTATLVALLSLAACGTKTYVPLTAANLGSEITAATRQLHTAHEVSSGSGVTTTIDFDAAGTFKYRLSQSGVGTTKTLIGIGSDRYLQDSGLVPAGKWLKLSSTSRIGLVTFAQVNPVAMVVRFGKGVTKFAYVGATRIGGEEVHHYRLTIDQQKFLQATGQSQSTANLGAGESITENLYLNADNTVRRVVLTLPGGVGDTQIDVTRWGAPVSIQAPPPSAVVTSVRPSQQSK